MSFIVNNVRANKTIVYTATPITPSMLNLDYLSLCVRKPTIWVPTRSDTNQAVQSQKMARAAGNFGFRKKRNCTIRVAKTKALFSFAVTAKLICADLRLCFRLLCCWFSYAADLR